ncbi:MAG: hypothetical protein CVU42_00490 [Chloroflexi bacterium HGW-Chloroflexi-4]|jgi:hypothetical protein|nr:MAG: hypothetical protein CVU46_17745 [Chloroflexi bacterium HGW-Chloroflexi-8]PKO01319.1 MAG: hypothetical protein CVU42_00490 [Chloroflexi bacterium HGW-Chloroflexi-4]
MKNNTSIIWIALIIIPLALIAAIAGVFWQGTGDSYSFQTLRGESVAIRGSGLYAFDTVNSSSQEIAQDVVTIIIGIPLLIVGVLLTKKGSMRGRLLLTGGLGYFLYTYASMSFLTAFNPFYLIYVTLFSLSLFGFILALSGLNPLEVTQNISNSFPRRGIAIYFLIVGAFLSMAWLGLVVPPIFSGQPPAGLESAITMVIQSLDLGVIVPTSVITAVLLLKNKPWGFTLAIVVLLKILTMGTALVAMILNQLREGIAIEPVTSIIFVLISLSGIFLAFLALRSVQQKRFV